AFQPYRGKPAVRNDRGDRGDVGIIRSPVRASVLPDRVRRYEARLTVLAERALPDPLVAAVDEKRLYGGASLLRDALGHVCFEGECCSCAAKQQLSNPTERRFES